MVYIQLTRLIPSRMTVLAVYLCKEYLNKATFKTLFSLKTKNWTTWN